MKRKLTLAHFAKVLSLTYIPALLGAFATLELMRFILSQREVGREWAVWLLSKGFIWFLIIEFANIVLFAASFHFLFSKAYAIRAKYTTSSPHE